MDKQLLGQPIPFLTGIADHEPRRSDQALG
jgi:hypothetical protein